MSPWGPLFRQVLQKFAKSQGRRILTRVGTRLAAGAAKAGAAAAASGAATAGTTAAGTAAAAGGGQILRTGKDCLKTNIYKKYFSRITISSASLSSYYTGCGSYSLWISNDGRTDERS